MALLDPKDWTGKWIGPPIEELGSAWGNYTISVDFLLVKNSASVVFRAADAENFYMWQIARTGEGPILRMQVRQKGEWRTLKTIPLNSFLIDESLVESHSLAIAAQNGRITSLIDGHQIDVTHDDTFLTGTVGFRSGGEEEAVFDNITVWAPDGEILLREEFNDDSLPHFTDGVVVNGQLLLDEHDFALYGSTYTDSSLLLRKEFHLRKNVAKATASAYGLGWFELYLNGRKVGNRVLTPANTRYKNVNLFETFDVTRYLRRGTNAAGFWLGNGYGKSYSPDGWRWEKPKVAILQLNIEFTDGSKASLVTDRSWRLSDASPLIEDDIYDGETFDARLEMAKWALPIFDDASWPQVAIAQPPSARLRSNTIPAVKVIKNVAPESLAQPQAGVYVFDMGRAMTGWTRLHVQGPPGTRVRLRHSMNIDSQGMIDPWTNQGARATDVYVLRGANSPESYEPRFTYHGFRYVEVTGFPGIPTLDSVEGRMIGADLRRTGRFKSSNHLLNRIHRNIVTSLRSNMLSIPTDNPVRDERTPAQMDVGSSYPAALYNFDMNRFYAKWLEDVRGLFSQPDWSGQQLTLPWDLYMNYGDRRELVKNYRNMKRYVSFLQADAQGHVIDHGFGDWVQPPPKEDPGNDWGWEHLFNDVALVNTGMYYRGVRSLSQAAESLHRRGDHSRYSALARSVKTAFNEAFLNSSGVYGDGGQTSAVLPLAWKLVPRDHREATAENLLLAINESNGHLDTGIYGTRHLIDVLADSGLVDVAFDVLMKRTYPSFGYQISRGATSLWEQWPERVDMQSHNHAMFAGIGSSFYTRFAGIQPSSPGFRKTRIRPSIPRMLQHVTASTKTVYGTLATEWRVNSDRGTLTLRVRVPVNTTARVHVPFGSPGAVTCVTCNIESAGVRFIRTDSAYSVFEVGSGTYWFRSSWPH